MCLHDSLTIVRMNPKNILSLFSANLAFMRMDFNAHYTTSGGIKVSGAGIIVVGCNLTPPVPMQHGGTVENAPQGDCADTTDTLPSAPCDVPEFDVFFAI